MEWQTLATVLPTAFASSFYAMVATTFLWAMRGTKPRAGRAGRGGRGGFRPSVTILKPVAGVDDGARANFESFAKLDYPEFEILFGVASPSDPAVPVIEAFLAAHPELDARLVLTTPPRGEVKNPKVAQLIDLTHAAKGTVLVVSDANVHVAPSYLNAMVDALQRPGVGLVSSVIAGTGERTLGAALENAQLNASVAPAVVTGHALFRRTVTIGKSMAMRRADLASAGGWESVAGLLAEDDTLGRRFRELGHRVELCLEPVFNRNVRATTARTIDRHARWAKMRRRVAPTLFTFEPLSWPLFIAVAAWMLHPSPLASRLCACAYLLQFLGAWLCHTILRARRPLILAALEPLRAFVSLSAWCLAATSRRVAWRGNVFYCGPGTKLIPLRAEVPLRELGELGELDEEPETP
jgi:ceramide glucosyltransferase